MKAYMYNIAKNFVCEIDYEHELPPMCTIVPPLEHKEGYYTKWDGDKWEYVPWVHIPTLDEVKAQKISELKDIRDIKEVEPIRTDKGLFDYDEKARDRIKDAMVALKYSDTIEWTLADNTDVSVSQLDLENVILAVASRSNDLHIKYRELKTQVNAAQTVEEVNAIQWTETL